MTGRLFSFLLVVCFVPGITGAAMAPRWALLSLTVPVAVMFLNLPAYGTGHVLGGLFLAWSAVTLAWTSSLPDGLHALWQLLLIAGAFLIGTAQPSLRAVYIGMGWGFVVNSGFVVLQAMGYEPLPVAPGVLARGALFLNPNYLAEPAALVLVGLLGHRLWWLALGVLPCIILPHWPDVAILNSRTSLLALGATGAVWLWVRVRWSALALVGALALLFVVVYLGDAAWRHDLERFTLWRDVVAQLTLQGNGLGSFYTSFPAYALGLDLLGSRPTHAHSDVLEIAYELGVSGVGLFLVFAVYAISGGPQIERFVWLALLVEAFVDMPLYFPVPQFLAGLVAGCLCRGRVSVRDLFHGRRVVPSDRLEKRAESCAGVVLPGDSKDFVSTELCVQNRSGYVLCGVPLAGVGGSGDREHAVGDCWRPQRVSAATQFAHLFGRET
jgi:hypothetical protein